MHYEVEDEFIDELVKNSFLRRKYTQFVESLEKEKSEEFLNDNPDFVQMMMHLSQSDKIRVVE